MAEVIGGIKIPYTPEEVYRGTVLTLLYTQAVMGQMINGGCYCSLFA
jgi:hypothetical protein